MRTDGLMRVGVSLGLATAVIAGLTTMTPAQGLGAREIGAGTPGAQATPRACPSPLSIDLDSPRWTRTLRAGVSAHRWWGWHASDGQRVPVTAVRIEPGAALLNARAPRLPRPLSATSLGEAARSYAVMNADYFRYMSGQHLIPSSAVMTNGQVRFAPRSWSPVVAIDSVGQARTDHVRVSGIAIIGSEELQVGSVNDPSDTTQGALYTSPWQGTIPSGPGVLLVVKAGKVIRVHGPGRDASLGSRGWAIRLTDAALIREATLGAAARIATSYESSDGLPVQSASGHGGVILREGRIKRLCSDYEGLLRPRTALAWDDSGTTWLLSAGTYQDLDSDGVRRGGATKSQMAIVARSLGATEAVTLDGGGSTIMLLRSGQGQWEDRGFTRVDSPRATYARPVPAYWSVEEAPS